MTGRAPHYYNDHDPKVCVWLRALIACGHLPEGDVDERSITDVDVGDLRGYVACHFFAGIGGWPLALRLAGWPGDRPVWTGSPPCQPFSSAGQRRSRDDDRHLAPAFLGLVWAAQPAVLFGEQVASSAVVGKATGRAQRGAAGPREWAWLDDLSDGLEAAGYAVGAGDVPAAGVGAPHIRQRLFFGAIRLSAPAVAADTGGKSRAIWMAEPVGAGLEGHAGHGDESAEPGRDDARPDGPAAAEGDAGRLGDAGCSPDERQRGPGEASGAPRPSETEARQQQWGGPADRADGTPRRVADADGGQPRQAGALQSGGEHGQQPADGGARGDLDTGWPGAADDPWRDADWLLCRDGKWRPVGPGSFPLADGVPARVVRLRGYGNAIVPQAAAEFVRAFQQATEEMAT